MSKKLVGDAIPVIRRGKDLIDTISQIAIGELAVCDLEQNVLSAPPIVSKNTNRFWVLLRRRNTIRSPWIHEIQGLVIILGTEQGQHLGISTDLFKKICEESGGRFDLDKDGGFNHSYPTEEAARLAIARLNQERKDR